MSNSVAKPSKLGPPSRNRVSRSEQDACRVLRVLRRQELRSWQQLESIVGLSPQRLASSVAFLERQGLLRSRKNGASPLAQKRLPEINSTYGHVVAVDIGGSNLRVGLADLTGSVLAKWAATTKATSSPEGVVAQIRKGIGELLQQTRVPRSSLLAVAAGAPGVTNHSEGIVFATSYLKGWRNVPFAGLLEKELGMPAFVENDVRLAAIGERWTGAARGIADFVFLAIGTGIAAGIFVNGQLVRGSEWVAGEVGYMIVPGTPEHPANPSEPGSLESVIGGEGIRHQWLTSSGPKPSGNGRDLTATGIFYHALAGNQQAREVLDRTAHILACTIHNLSSVLNPSLFVLGGGVGMNGPLIAATERILEPYTQPSHPKLIASELGQDAQLLGAVRLALDAAESSIDRTLTKSTI